jgi:hypothetical protein
MVAEFGSLAVGGNRAAWYQAALTDLPEKYPSVKARLFFNAKSDQTVTYQKLNWSIAGDAALARTVAAAIKPWHPKQPSSRGENPHVGSSPRAILADDDTYR